MNSRTCPKCKTEDLTMDHDGYITCETCWSVFEFDLDYVGYFEEGGDEPNTSDNPYFSKREE